MYKAVKVGSDKPAIPGQCCFELVTSISHQQGICITCLAHHLVYIHKGEPECVHVHDVSTCIHIYMYMYTILTYM